MKLRLLVPLVLLLPITALASQQGVVQYHYGMHLDVAKVLNIQKPAQDPQCKVVNAVMTYLDSSGQVQKLGYRMLSDSCTEQG